MDLHSMVINLKPLNTFGISVTARVFSIKNTVNLLDYFNKFGKNNYFVLGGGSNIILGETVKNKDILKIEIMGKQIVDEDGDIVYVKIGAGENWDNVVSWSIEQGLSGIEALSAIPGNAGATPVQNVGAYGTEIKDVLESVTAYDTTSDKFVVIKNEDCGFGYRTSVFKNQLKGQYIITDIILKLSTNSPKIPDYDAVKKYFIENKIENPTALEIRNVITDIRWSKLPHPEELGNCGSFFENPVVLVSVANSLKEKFIDMPIYDLGGGLAKIPAGYLIEKSGLKGSDFGNVGTYEKNALVLVNKGSATYEDVLNTKKEIINKVKNNFDIELRSEPEFVE